MEPIKIMAMSVNGNWRIGNLSVLKNKLGCVPAGSYISNPCGSPFAFQVRPETISYSTTIHDSEGQEIYAGHLLMIDEVVCEVYWSKRYLQWFLKYQGDAKCALMLIPKGDRKIIGHVATGWPDGKCVHKNVIKVKGETDDQGK